MVWYGTGRGRYNRPNPYHYYGLVAWFNLILVMSTQYELFTGLEARLIDPQEIPWPADSIVAYAIEDDQVIGRVGLLQFPHIEGTWIREDKRGGFVLMRLMNKVESVLEEQSRSSVFSFAESNQTEVHDYLKRLGYVEMPLKVFAKKLNVEQKVA